MTQDIQIIKEDNPLKIKGILGVSSGTVGSRFHDLVSALSQGTEIKNSILLKRDEWSMCKKSHSIVDFIKKLNN